MPEIGSDVGANKSRTTAYLALVLVLVMALVIKTPTHSLLIYIPPGVPTIAHCSILGVASYM